MTEQDRIALLREALTELCSGHSISGAKQGRAALAATAAPKQQVRDRDAERYRYMKHNPMSFDGGFYVTWDANNLDAIVDAAIAAAPKEPTK